MSDVFQRIMRVHRDRIARGNKKRAEQEKKLETARNLFRATGIPEMWDDVKNIRVVNFCPEHVLGYQPQLHEFLDAASSHNINGTGLCLYRHGDSEYSWCCIAFNDTDFQYHSPDGSGSQKDSNFVDIMRNSFVKWLAKRITPQMIEDMGIDVTDIEAAAPTRRLIELEPVISG